MGLQLGEKDPTSPHLGKSVIKISHPFEIRRGT
jgi:hypothetical protein